MDIEDLDIVAKRVFERCMPAKEEMDESAEKSKFLEAFSGLEYSTIGHLLYETIKIALIVGGADIVIGKIKSGKGGLEKSGKKMEKAAFEVLNEKISDETEARQIAIKISTTGREEFEIHINSKK
ncbi:MAG: hypothetical protein KFBDDELM_00217 [Candidatus Argoarchaeum ethanivorans]|uniref:Uncharacterized protein n=1 Tax=Candidatus Argoarchaeum ethanivorans TaxID=2608793 RepID=A0A811T0N9_9EURY|nr:MAG: hypothetical protein KFBDDELM_00217 [Candidatus Argoarchaeum ethanivorans]